MIVDSRRKSRQVGDLYIGVVSSNVANVSIWDKEQFASQLMTMDDLLNLRTALNNTIIEMKFKTKKRNNVSEGN